jgi:hypothetical protein
LLRANLNEAEEKKEIVFLFFFCFWLAAVWIWRLMILQPET